MRLSISVTRWLSLLVTDYTPASIALLVCNWPCLQQLSRLADDFIGPPGEQAHSPRHSVVYFSRPNGNIKLKSLLDPDDGEEAMTADAWIAQRAKLRRTANFQGADTYHASRGTEHTKDRDRPKLDKPAKEVEAV
jgi:hypothetical protein